MKTETINQLEEKLKRIKETRANMIKTYEAKFSEFGIQVEKLDSSLYSQLVKLRLF